MKCWEFDVEFMVDIYDFWGDVVGVVGMVDVLVEVFINGCVYLYVFLFKKCEKIWNFVFFVKYVIVVIFVVNVFVVVNKFVSVFNDKFVLCYIFCSKEIIFIVF